jgi:fructose-specific phosphotransferase system IIC component
MFWPGDGRFLGLWLAADVQPPVNAAAGCMGFGLVVADDATMEAPQARWWALRFPDLQPPPAMDIGTTACA